MTFGLFNVIVAIYVENIVTAAKFNSRQSKRKRLLDKDMMPRQEKWLHNDPRAAWKVLVVMLKCYVADQHTSTFG
eukprot:5963966-Amphidinium_carterae.1